MNKSVNPLLAVIIVVIFGGLFALKTYFYQQALDVSKVNYLKTSPDGNVFIRLGDSLYEYSDTGELIRILSLASVGITGELGDFAFFSNGDILINRDQHLPTVNDKLRSYQRKTNTNQSVAAQGKGLQRCNMDLTSCVLFSDEIPALQSAHHLYIDSATDDVYLADTSRHQIRKLDKQGVLLAELKTDLKFPNQLWLDQGTLWIVDTNHHVMKAVQAETEIFGEVIEEHKAIASAPWIWPSAFSRVAENWWVNISDHAMENAKVLIFDKSWKELKTLDLPKNADPVASLALSDSVLIADANQYALYQFDFEGQRLQDFAIQGEDLTGIQAVLERNKQVNKQYLLWSDYSLWTGIALFIPLFIYALVLAIRDKQSKQIEPVDIGQNEARLNVLPEGGEWLEAKLSSKVLRWFILINSVCIAILILASILVHKDKLSQELLLIEVSLFLFSLLLMPLVKLSKLRVGFFQDKVTLETDKGASISSAYDEIKWHPRAFIMDKWVVPIGRPAQSMFPYQQLYDSLMPHVLESNRLSLKELLIYQWHSPDATLKYSVLSMVLATALIVFL